MRLATTADLDVLARHRVAMFVEMGSLAAGSAESREIEDATRLFVAETMASDEWFAWIVEDATGVLGSGAALLRRLAPRPGHAAGGTEAYLLSFYTEPRARRRGVATTVMRACLAWCAARGITRITLHASDAGRPVYTPLGFADRKGEMVWTPPIAAPRAR